MESSVTSPGWRHDVGVHTEVGHVREHNEDSFGLAQSIGLFAVADGMGGHNAGERASHLAIEEILDYLGARVDNGLGSETVTSAIRFANDSIFRESLEFRDRRGMGTTLTAILLRGARYLIGQVGDSRAWRVRAGEATQLTDDHSVIAEQMRHGILTPEQAAVHPMRNVLTRSLGNMPEVSVDVLEGEVLDGDVFVLATDGMVRAVDEAAIAAAIADSGSASDAALAMVEKACADDGTDNVTAIVVTCRSA